MGGPVWACFVGLFLWVCFPSQKQLQSNEKQTTTTTAKDIFFIVFSVYRDMKTKAKKQIKFCYIYKVSKKLQKKLKKICKVIFLLYLCTSETKNKRPC